ncbi:MAG: Actin cross-linking toxin VgrG1 [Pseudomonas sp.]|nr:MAG: Actin cross-linking toxin VgrG1 [Pseudomonas sp.]
MPDANEPSIFLTLDGVSTDLQVLGFIGREALNQPFRFDIDLVSSRPDLKLENLLHATGRFSFGATGKGLIHGQVCRVEQGDSSKKLTRYSVSLVPQLAYLQHNFDQQIFQQLSVPKIIAQVLEARGILADAYRFQLRATYPEREYCVQYGESDLHFIQRLCEEEGIHFHFQHSASGHTLVFGDDQTVFRKLAPVSYRQDSGMVAEKPLIKQFNLRVQAQTPCTVEGRGDEPTLLTGHFLPLTDHPRAEWNDLWLLQEVIHEGKQPQVLGENLTSDVTDNKDGFYQGYRNHFLATPWDAHYRPALAHKKTMDMASQSAIVTGPAGEEIHCDQYGRVKVQFHWDREGQADDKTSCWLRVATGWAGNRYGGIALPRIGMEVLVTFMEGDPDQPLIMGCLYHKENPVPYPLPAHKTRTVFKTLSSPGGKGYNELRIEDKKARNRSTCMPGGTGMNTSGTTRISTWAMSGTTRWRPMFSVSSRPKSSASRIWTARPKCGRTTT